MIKYEELFPPKFLLITTRSSKLGELDPKLEIKKTTLGRGGRKRRRLEGVVA